MLEHASLPIDVLRDPLLAEAGLRPVVITAATGAGKSTQVPRWLGSLGPALVIEPRRVACRGLAARVAELEGVVLGREVGYAVRADTRAREDTRVVYATPGVVLRWLAQGPLSRFRSVVLDEFHERSLEVDLLLALLRKRRRRDLVVMSATLDAARIARHLDGVHLEAPGRSYPVTTHYLPAQAFLPDPRGIEERVREALGRCARQSGDVLVFLPGKGEIERVAAALRGLEEWEVFSLHGGLSLEQQSRVFRPGSRRRVVLATNVAETSLTLPGIGAVIDSGLVRRTRYHNGRGHLTLLPVALDSVAQRAGRAGRTGPGTCYRLWSSDAILTATTPPEIHREALDSLVLAAAACGERAGGLTFLDPPQDYALAAARDNLGALGALDAVGQITTRGRKLYGLPLDAPLGSLLLQAAEADCLDDALDLVAGLAVGQPLFLGARPSDPAGDLRQGGCDAVALIRAVRQGRPRQHGLRAHVLDEARAVRRQLREAWGLPEAGAGDGQVDRRRLASAALRADLRCAHLARRRKKATAWSNGGTEATLGRDSAVDADACEALLVLDSRAFGTDRRKTALRITCAMPVPLAWLLEAGLGEERAGASSVRDGVLTTRVETWYAGRRIAEREEVPRGLLAREAVGDLFLQGRAFPGTLDSARQRLAAAQRFAAAERAGLVPAAVQQRVELEGGAPRLPASLEGWVAEQLLRIGVESGEDLGLLGSDDLLPPALPAFAAQWLDSEFPAELKLGDASYRIEYDFTRRIATLVRTAGNRREPPSATFLPTLRGFSVQVRHKNQCWQVR